MKLSTLFKIKVPKKLFHKLDEKEVDILNKKFWAITEIIGILSITYFIMVALAILLIVTDSVLIMVLLAIALLAVIINHARKEKKMEEAETLIIGLALEKGMVKELVKEIKDNEKNNLR